LRKDNFKVKTTLSVGVEDPVAVVAVVDTGAGPSVVSEDLLPPGWRAHAWRAPIQSRIVNASGQDRKALDRLPLTLHEHDKPTHFTFIVVKRFSVPLIIRCDFQRQYNKAILTQDGKIEWSTGAVSDILGYHLGARGRQYRAQAKPRVRPSAQTLAGATVLPPGAQTEVQLVTWSTGRCLIKVRTEFSAKHRLHLAHGHHKKVHRHESLSALLVNLGRKTKTFANGTRVGVAEPCTGEARTLSQGALLAVQQELAARQELDLQATMAEAEGPPCDGRTPGPTLGEPDPSQSRVDTWIRVMGDRIGQSETAAGSREGNMSH